MPNPSLSLDCPHCSRVDTLLFASDSSGEVMLSCSRCRSVIEAATAAKLLGPDRVAALKARLREARSR